MSHKTAADLLHAKPVAQRERRDSIRWLMVSIFMEMLFLKVQSLDSEREVLDILPASRP